MPKNVKNMHAHVAFTYFNTVGFEQLFFFESKSVVSIKF